jgi:hypothetical protein
MYSVLVNVNHSSKEFAISNRRLDANKHWKEANGFYFDTSDKSPRPFFVFKECESEDSGKEARAVIRAMFALGLSYTEVDVKSH